MLLIAAAPPWSQVERLWPLFRWTATASSAWAAYDEAVAGLIEDVSKGAPEANAIANVAIALSEVALADSFRATVIVSGNPVQWRDAPIR